MKSVRALEIDIAPVHHVEGAELWKLLLEYIDVVQLPVGDVNEASDVAAQID